MEPNDIKDAWGWFGKEIAEFGLRWLVVVALSGVLSVLGILLFGRNYKKRIADLEGKLEQQSPVTVNVNQGEPFDAEAVARDMVRQVKEAYTEERATEIVRAFQPGGHEYERLEKGATIGRQATENRWHTSPGAGRLAAKLIATAPTLDEAREIWETFCVSPRRTETRWAYWAFISCLEDAGHGDEVYDLAHDLAENGESLDPDEAMEAEIRRWKGGRGRDR